MRSNKKEVFLSLSLSFNHNRNERNSLYSVSAIQRQRLRLKELIFNKLFDTLQYHLNQFRLFCCRRSISHSLRTRYVCEKISCVRSDSLISIFLYILSGNHEIAKLVNENILRLKNSLTQIDLIIYEYFNFFLKITKIN